MSLEFDLSSSSLAKAKRVRSARMLAGLNRHDIQEKYGIHENTLKSWEKPSENSKGLTIKGAQRLIEVLASEGVECSVSWLLTGHGEGPKVNYQNNINFPEIIVPEMELNQDIAILKEVQFFLDINEDAVILLVSDSNMAPLYQLGDYVGGYSRTGHDIRQLVNMDCIIELEEGVKMVARLLPSAEENLYRICQLNTSSASEEYKNTPYKIKGAAAIAWHRKKDFSIKRNNTQNSEH